MLANTCYLLFSGNSCSKRWGQDVISLWFNFLSLMNKDVEHLFTDLLAICMHFWINVYSGLLISFYLDYFYFHYWAMCVCVWILIPYQIYVWQILSPFSRMYFPVVDNFLQCEETSLVWCSHICLLWLLFPLLLKSDLKIQPHDQFQGAFPLYSPKRFMVSSLTFRSLIHLELIFVYGVWV